MNAPLPTTVAGFVADLVEGLGDGLATTVGGVPGRMVGDYARRRGTVARRILAKEIAAKDLDVLAQVDSDALLAAVFRFQRAVIEGATRPALRLMARVFGGTVLAGERVVGRFLCQADALASLTGEEIFLLGRMHGHRLAYQTDVMKGARKPDSPWQRTIAAFIPEPFGSRLELESACGRLARTGLLAGYWAFDMPMWQTGPLMDELVGLVPLEDFTDDAVEDGLA